jgi:glutaredoxin 3
MYILYGAKNCRFCTMAIKLLDDHNVKYIYNDITENKTQMLDSLAKRTGNKRTVPLVFVDNVFIGGYYDLYNEFTCYDELDDF